jgi:hypothetical protein
MSWAQWFADSSVPGVLRARWFEQRHMLHHTRRWHRDRGPELRSAWLNGVGMLVWEVVFGSWVGWSARDRSMLRTMVAIERAFTRHLSAGVWTPLADGTNRAFEAGVHASRFELAGSVLWTLVNGSERDYDGPLLATRVGTGGRWFDLTAGREVRVTKGVVEGHIEAGGIGAVLTTDRPADLGIEALLRERAQALRSSDRRSPDRRADRLAARRVPPRATTEPGAAGMRAVQAYRGDLLVTWRLRETGLYGGAPFVDEWKPLPPRLHRRMASRRTVDVAPFLIASRPVTVGELARFREEHGSAPTMPRPFDPETPATGMDLAEARGFARWAGARLPTEDEWQVAAGQGLLEPGARSVWEWTESEHTDGRTRWCILKGGPDGGLTGSEWYVEGGRRPPTESLKLLLLGAGLSRSPWIGFRLARDTRSGPGR